MSKWMKELTKTKSQIGWIVTALDSITKNTIMAGFIKAGIVNPANPPELLKSVVVNMSSCFLIPHLIPQCITTIGEELLSCSWPRLDYYLLLLGILTSFIKTGVQPATNNVICGYVVLICIWKQLQH